MYHRIQFLALGSIALLSGSSATPAPAPTAVNCNDVTTGLDPSCWAKLNMTGYLRNWGATTLGADGTASIENPDSETGPTSTSTSVSPFVTGGDIGFRRRAAGCQAGEPWSTCFLRLGLGHDGEDCTRLGPNKCPAPQVGAAPHTPQIFYGIWNIYGEFFQSTRPLAASYALLKLTPLQPSTTTSPRFTQLWRILFRPTSASSHKRPRTVRAVFLTNSTLKNHSRPTPSL